MNRFQSMRDDLEDVMGLGFLPPSMMASSPSPAASTSSSGIWESLGSVLGQVVNSASNLVAQQAATQAAVADAKMQRRIVEAQAQADVARESMLRGRGMDLLQIAGLAALGAGAWYLIRRRRRRR